MAYVYGTPGDDNPLPGTPGDDRIFGYGGNDTIFAGDGNDIVDAGEGDDSIYIGNGGSEHVDGGNGTDTLYFSDYAGFGWVAGAVIFDNGDGTGIAASVDANHYSIDYTQFSNVEILVTTDALSYYDPTTGFVQYSDQVEFYGSDYTVYTLSGVDIVFVGSGIETVYLGSDGDFIAGYTASEFDGTIIGDLDAGDTIQFHSELFDMSDVTVAYDGTVTTLAIDSNQDGAVDGTIILLGDYTDGEFVTLNINGRTNLYWKPNADQTYIGDEGFNIQRGGFGNDTYYGRGGNDFLQGWDGNDTIYGEDGLDWLEGGNGDDLLDGGNGDDVAIGGSGNDTLAGGLGADALIGDDGDDTLEGGGGNDFLVGGAGADEFILGSADGSDTIADFELGVDTIDFAPGLTISAITDADVDSDGTLDTVVDLSNGETLTLLGVSGLNKSDLIMPGSPAPNQVLRGTSAGEMLNGGSGDDILFGRGGDDFLTGGGGADHFIYGSRDGSDTITDFEIGIDSFTLQGNVSVDSWVEQDVDGDGVMDTVFTMSNGETLTFLSINGITDSGDIFG